MSIVVNTADRIEKLNDQCFCIPDQSSKLQYILEKRLQDVPSFFDGNQNFKPFSDAAIFLRNEDSVAMVELIAAIEKVVALPAYKARVLERQPKLNTNINSDTHGLLMGYDFHITPMGPKLIEINTNAGGAFVSKMLSGRAFENSNCCDVFSSSEELERSIDDMLFSMFIDEWKAARPGQPLKTVAILDEKPNEQYLYPDMLLCEQFLVDRGISAFVCSISDLRFKAGAVFYKNKKIDLIYNRLTDFMLDEFENSKLRSAFENDHVVISPAPIHHALYADKRNLELLASKGSLIEIGVDEQLCKALSIIPDTKEFKNIQHEDWWKERRNYFFKPHSGYGSRGAYRGDKLTKKVWNDIKSGGFIVQELIKPSTRNTKKLGAIKPLKYDVRVYAFAGKALFMVARLYSGQTTNFRTAGGGFAEVMVL